MSVKGRTTGSGNKKISLAHDPKNRDGEDTSFVVGTDIDTTTLQTEIPFELNL